MDHSLEIFIYFLIMTYGVILNCYDIDMQNITNGIEKILSESHILLIYHNTERCAFRGCDARNITKR